jgi:uncharacterized protein YfaS (alpha-2-macroglobulin family)
LKEITGTLNAEGTFSFSFNSVNDSTSNYTYTFEANVTDASLREIRGSASVISSITDFTVTANCDKYYVKPGSEIVVTAKTYDSQYAPFSKDLTIIINKTTYINNKQLVETVKKDEFRTNDKGVGFYNFSPTADGFYDVTVTGVGSNGRTTLDQTSFYVFSSSGSYYYGQEQNAQILTDKEAYLPGDTIKALIYLPNKLAEGVITIEQNSIIKAEKITLKNGFAEYKFIAGKNYYPSINVFFSGAYKQSLVTAVKKVGVINEDAKLNVKITPSKNRYKPGEETEYIVKVTDKNGNPVRDAQLSFGSVDESIYAIKSDNTPPLFDSFYKDEYYYTQTSSSLEGKYGQAMSRPFTLIDLKFDPTDNDQPTKGNSAIEIKFKSADDIDRFENVDVLITNGYLLKRANALKNNFSKFTDLPDGEYDICLAYFNTVYPLKRISVGNNKTYAEEISLEPYINDLEFYLSGNFAGGMDRMTKGAEYMEGSSTDTVAKATNPSGNEEIDVRQNFMDAPYWNPALVTNSSGEAEINFKLPDNLTSWRSTVRVITKNTFTGESINNVLATKDLLIRAETSRFFKEGDTTTIIANIHNYFDSDAKTKFKFNFNNITAISFEVKGVTITKKTANSFETSIPSKGLATVEIKTVIPFNSFTSELYFEAISDKESDALKIDIPIIPKGIKNVNYLNSIVQSTENEKTIDFTIPQGVNLKTVNLSLATSPTIASTLLNSLDGLVEYPYGCVEQTMSRFLPALITANTLKKLNAKVSSATMEKLPDVIQKSLERLYDFQNNQGGWGWWKNDPTNPYMTAYVMYGLKMADDLGYKVNKNALISGYTALTNLLSETNVDGVTAAYIAFVFYDIDSNAAKMNPVFTKVMDNLLADSLNAYATSLIGLVYSKMGDKKTEAVVLKRLMNSATEDQNFISWGRDKYYTWQHDKVQSTAYALKFLIAADSTSPAIIKAVRTLLREQKGSGWYSTQQTSTAIFALTDYLKSTNELDPDFSAEVFINGKSIKKVSFDKDNIYSADALLNLNSSNFNFLIGKNTIKLVKKGKGTLYIGSEVNLYYPDISFIKDNSFSVTKEVFKLKEVRSGNSIEYQKSQFDKVALGEMILVKLKVKTNRTDDQYMMVEDMLPAGFEIIKDEQLYNIQGESSYSGHRYDYWNYFYADKEIRDSKITFFVTYAPQEMEFTYLLRAQTPGSYSSAPPYTGLMYYPEIRGYGNRTTFKISGE